MMRNTRQREKVLKQLEKTNHPQSAEMIFNNLKREKINLATIYRALNTFLENGLLSKSVINQTAYYTHTKHGHHHFLICLSCNRIEEFECDIEDTVTTSSKHKFQIAYHDTTYFGYCEDCANKEKNL